MKNTKDTGFICIVGNGIFFWDNFFAGVSGTGLIVNSCGACGVVTIAVL